MVLSFIVAVLLAAGGSLSTSDRGTDLSDAELPATVDTAIELLEEELVLLPVANPSRAADPDFQTTRNGYAAVQRQGTDTLVLLEAADIELTPAALTDLRLLRAELAAAAAPPPTATSNSSHRPTIESPR